MTHFIIILSPVYHRIW